MNEPDEAFEELKAIVLRIKKERDDLLAAAKRALTVLRSGDGGDEYGARNALASAIAKVECRDT